VRRAAEGTVRAGVLTALVLLAWRAGRPEPRPAMEVARGAAVPAALARWSVSPAPESLHASLDLLPGPVRRDWLRALAHAGSRVTWSVAAAAPTALTVAPPVTPRGGARVRVAAPDDARVALADAAGPLASVAAAGAGVSATVPALVGAVRATAAGSAARAVLADSAVLRRVLVLGRAGWESKFVIAALEEDGWTVDARIVVAPSVTVTQRANAPLDTSRYSAVVALDSSARPYAARIARFVRDGGGVVLAGEAARLAPLAALAPGRVAPRAAGVAGALASAEPRRGLALLPVARLKPDAVPLERRADAVAAAARRAGAGRVVQVGYDETWRWRMLGGDEAASAHRRWWSAVVGGAAYAPAVARAGWDRRSPDATPPDPAPYASTVAALGAPRPAAPAAATPHGTGVPWWLFFPIAAALLAEWGSRRLRGAA